eukprot:GFUD01018521.1.p1 GENE.GFUD01018521.1~~GFUD01018521.1.p1  ORF type:complete len:409 (+),score=82.58 GFUD01018521.1:308-1534(+)
MLVTFVVFALLAFLLLLALLWYILPSSRVATSVPGLRPSHQTLGNLPNISDAGGLPAFLKNVHCEYGSISSFWLGDYLAISVGSYNLFKLVDKSCPKSDLPYQTIVPLTLDKNILEKSTSSDAFLNSILSGFSPFSQPCPPSLAPQVTRLTKELCGVLAKACPEDQVPIQDYVTALAVKIVAETAGKDSDVAKLRLAYTNLLLELGTAMESGREMGEDKRKLLIQREEEFIKIVDRNNGPTVFGLITVISVLSTWVLYYLARNDKLQAEVSEDNSLLKLFLAEVVRVTAFVPLTARVLAKQDLNILGHTLEPGTVVINSISTVCWDDEVFTNPEAVDVQRDFNNLPDVLSYINSTADSSYSYCVIMTIVKTIISAFKLDLADPEVDIGKKFSFVMRPETDIWLKLQKM